MYQPVPLHSDPVTSYWYILPSTDPAPPSTNKNRLLLNQYHHISYSNVRLSFVDLRWAQLYVSLVIYGLYCMGGQKWILHWCANLVLEVLFICISFVCSLKPVRLLQVNPNWHTHTCSNNGNHIKCASLHRSFTLRKVTHIIHYHFAQLKTNKTNKVIGSAR